MTPDAIDAEEAKKLAALGYVSGGSDSNAPSRDPRECLGDLAQLKDIATMRRQGREAEAIARLASMLAANPRWSDIRDQLGAAYDDAGDHLRAARLYEDGIRATPRLAGAFALSAASSLFDAHRFDEAAAHAYAAETTKPAGAHLLLGEIALARNDLAAAAREQSLAVSFDNSRGHAQFLAARIAAAQHEFARAIELLKAADDTCQQDGESLPRGFHYAAGDALLTSAGLPMPSASSQRRSRPIPTMCSRTLISHCCRSCGAIARPRCRPSTGWRPRTRAATPTVLRPRASIDGASMKPQRAGSEKEE